MAALVRLGGRVFAPSLLATCLVALLCAGFVRLGLWQWHKWVHARDQWAQFARGAGEVQPLAGRRLADVRLFQRVSLEGRLDPEHQFLLDNRTARGNAGYEVLTPLTRADDGQVLLIDRGWVPFTGSRAHLPQISFADPLRLQLTGRVANLPSAGLASGRAPPERTSPWPKVTSYPTTPELERALGQSLEPRILLLDPQEPLGFVREWEPPGLPPLRYLSYAIQWWCFAALALVIWAVTSARRDTPPGAAPSPQGAA
jgi:surfeit locus 1 family protein